MSRLGDLWASLTGQVRRDAIVKESIFKAYKAVVLRDAVQRVRREYLPHPASGSPEYDAGYGDAILDITRLLDPDFPPPYIKQEPTQESESTS